MKAIKSWETGVNFFLPLQLLSGLVAELLSWPGITAKGVTSPSWTPKGAAGIVLARAPEDSGGGGTLSRIYKSSYSPP